MCKACTEALWTQTLSQVWTCVKYVPKQCPRPPQKKVHRSPPHENDNMPCLSCWYSCSTIYMKDLGPRHLGHAVGMTHAGTLAAPVPMKFLNMCHAGTLAAPFYIKVVGPGHLGHVVGMTHAGTLAAPVPMKFLTMCGTFAAPISEVWNMLVTLRIKTTTCHVCHAGTLAAPL